MHVGSPKDFHLSTDLSESIRYIGFENNDAAATWRKTPVGGSCGTEIQQNPALMADSEETRWLVSAGVSGNFPATEFTGEVHACQAKY
jgi:hypothetical protein